MWPTRGGTFHTDGSDLTGTWRFQRFTAGNDNIPSGWAYGTMQFAFGSATITSMTTKTGSGGSGNFAFSMDPNGIMTQAGNASFHEVMSMDRSTSQMTFTMNGGWMITNGTGGVTTGGTTGGMMGGGWVP